MKLTIRIIKKILWYRDNYAGVGETARALGISRYQCGYWFGNWKRKPKLRDYTPENVEAEYKKIKAEKALINSSILKGLFDDTDPVRAGRELRNEYKARYDLWPEEIV